MNEWKFLKEIEPTEEDKEYLCLAVSIRENKLKHYLLLRYWQNNDDKFNKRGFIDSGGNIIIAWAEAPELPKDIPLSEVIEKNYEQQSKRNS